MTPQACYHSLKRGVDRGALVMASGEGATPENKPAEDQTQSKQSSELAQIQATSALTLDHELLIEKSATQPRTELVLKFVDFSSKYGLGYMLSNGSYGVLFNDSTKIILHPNLFHFDYIERPKQQPLMTENGQAAESLTD